MTTLNLHRLQQFIIVLDEALRDPKIPVESKYDIEMVMRSCINTRDRHRQMGLVKSQILMAHPLPQTQRR